MKSEKNFLVTLFLCIFLGWLGIHRFYVGKIGTGILYLLTFGFGGIGLIIDVILLVCRKFKDKEGNVIDWVKMAKDIHSEITK